MFFVSTPGQLSTSFPKRAFLSLNLELLTQLVWMASRLQWCLLLPPPAVTGVGHHTQLFMWVLEIDFRCLMPVQKAL